MIFNINDKGRVRLTPFGKGILKKNHDKLYGKISAEYLQQNPYVPIVENGEGWSTWQLWNLMREFGEFCVMGFNNLPFETNIEVVTD